MPQGSREIQKLIRDLRQQGFEVKATTSNHMRVIATDGRACSIPTSPGSVRSFKNTLAYLQREVGYLTPEKREQAASKARKAAKAVPA